MSKLILTLGAIVALTAIFVIPSAYSPTSTQVAKASSCSFSSNGGSISFTSPGSCSASSAATSNFAAQSLASGKSTCTTTSASRSSSGAGGDVSNGAVSCSSHSP